MKLPTGHQLWLVLVVLAFVKPVHAAEKRFAQCLNDLHAQAANAGLSATLLERTLGTARYEQRVIDLDRRQPEFTDTAANYLNRRVTDQRIAQGRELLQSHQRLLQRIARDYGVASQYLLAFWGLESNFGGNFGGIPVLNSLATLACDERRSSYFTAELINALHIVDRGDVEPAGMVGSWAGAMGHTQFMPSAYLQHAVNGDGDSRIDLWGSVPDALASAGNFLQSLGWQEGVRWGREIRLPEGFPYEQAGLDRPRPLQEWHRLEISDVDGRALPQVDIEAALIIPGAIAVRRFWCTTISG